MYIEDCESSGGVEADTLIQVFRNRTCEKRIKVLGSFTCKLKGGWDVIKPMLLLWTFMKDWIQADLDSNPSFTTEGGFLKNIITISPLEKVG